MPFLLFSVFFHHGLMLLSIPQHQRKTAANIDNLFGGDTLSRQGEDVETPKAPRGMSRVYSLSRRLFRDFMQA